MLSQLFLATMRLRPRSLFHALLGALHTCLLRLANKPEKLYGQGDQWQGQMGRFGSIVPACRLYWT